MAEIFVRIIPGEKPGVNHDPIRISVSEQDSVVWVCRTHPFKIVNVRPDTQHRGKRSAPRSPFYRTLPFTSSEKGLASSGPAKPKAIGHQFKSTIQVGNHLIDPHIIVEA